MKSDKYGTYSEQIRFKMGFLSPTSRRKAGKSQRCATCRFFKMEAVNNDERGCDIKIRCMHVMVPRDSGLATAENALCQEWEAKP